jgi:hypothetical protein
MSGIWNEDFTKIVQAGAAGNQAQRGVFYDDDQGVVRRLTEAEGHEVSYNPEIAETNPIGQEAPEDLVRTYRETFGKDIIIKKGASNYEFFKNWLDLRPTGDNAKLKIYMVDFMEEEAGAKHNKYIAYSYMATCTVDSGNYTDGRLTVNFSQAGDRVTGIMQRIDTSISDDPSTFVYGFTPSKNINITSIKTSDESVTVSVGGEKWVKISFSPLGCPHDFIVSSSDESICTVERRRQSVIIRGCKDGSAVVTVTSTSDALAVAEINVTAGV